MNNPAIIFFDIDDTLYRKYTDTLRPSVAQAMRALKAKGILTAIATGRPEAAIPAKVKALIQECGIDMLVTINGQYISFRGEPLQSYPLDIADIETAIHLLEQHKIDYAFVNNQEIAVSSSSPRVVEGLSHILPNFLTDKEYFRKQPVYQMLVFVDEEEEKSCNRLPSNTASNPSAGTNMPWTYSNKKVQKHGASPTQWKNWGLI